MTPESRLFTVALLVLAIGSAFAWAGKLTPDWITLATYVVGLFAAGQATNAVAKPAGEWLAAKAREILDRPRIG
jgi:hypothetical protein